MSRITYPSVSPYSATPQNSWYLGRMVWRAIPENSGDKLFVLLARHQNRPDTLAFDLYASPAYWWVFCVRNPFLRADPVWSMTAGQAIWVPTADYLRSVVG